ncbi:MAG: citramalate synthase, partial [Clostridia bacterium]|nr:citramalate synthase [Clostridia bacterium]
MLEIYDCTLREGMQAEGVSFSLSDKLAVIKALDSLGVAYIEAGTPGSNPKDEELFRKLRDVETDATLVAFGATRRKELTCAEDENLAALADAGTKVVAVYGKAWDKQVTEVLRTELDENLAMVRESVAFLREAGKRVFFDAEH